MRSFLIAISISAFVIVLGCAKAATTSTQAEAATATPAQTGDDAPRIPLADAKKEFDDRTAVFVDVRSPAAYTQERIKGSINMPTETLEANYKSLPADKKIIAYCS